MLSCDGVRGRSGVLPQTGDNASSPMVVFSVNTPEVSLLHSCQARGAVHTKVRLPLSSVTADQT